jgi:uncharacterized protein YecA (UPF0149 family)
VAEVLKGMMRKIINDDNLKREDTINNVIAGIAAYTKLPEMEPHIVQFMEQAEMDDAIHGDVESVLELLHNEDTDFEHHPYTGFELIEYVKEHAVAEDDAENASDWDNDFYDEGGDEPAEQALNPYKSIGRNDPCPCGSGKKFKKCHWSESKQE